jgi:hypothetical protein
MVAGVLLMFPARYLGLIGEAAHQLVPSLLASVAFAAGFGLLLAEWEECGRRRAERDEGDPSCE